MGQGSFQTIKPKHTPSASSKSYLTDIVLSIEVLLSALKEPQKQRRAGSVTRSLERAEKSSEGSSHKAQQF